MLERIVDNFGLLLQPVIAGTAMVTWIVTDNEQSLSVAGFSLTAIIIMLLLDIRSAVREASRGKTEERKTDAED